MAAAAASREDKGSLSLPGHTMGRQRCAGWEGTKKSPNAPAGDGHPSGYNKSSFEPLWARNAASCVVITSRGHREVDVHGNRGGPRP